MTWKTYLKLIIWVMAWKISIWIVEIWKPTIWIPKKFERGFKSDILVNCDTWGAQVDQGPRTVGLLVMVDP